MRFFASIVFTIVVMGLLWAHTSWAGTDTVVLTTIDLNGDCEADTILGDRVGSLAVSTLRVRWGTRPANNGCDSTWYNEDTNRTYVDTTNVEFSGMTDVRYGVFGLRHNGDTHRDLVINVQGHLTRIVGADTVESDTTLTAVVFAQRGLDTLESIVLGHSFGLHTDSSVYRVIGPGNGIVVVDSLNRSSTYRGSIPRFTHTVNIRAVDPQPLVMSAGDPSGLPSREAATLRVVPNPAGLDAVDVFVDGIGAPRRLLLVTSSGEQLRTFTVPVGTGQRISMQISGVASGMYGVVAFGDNGAMAVGQFIIQR